MDLDDAISALEALAIQLEAADSNLNDSRLNEAISESIFVADAVLAAEDRSMWRALANSVVPNEQAATSTGAKAQNSAAGESFPSRCSNSRCGTLCDDEDLRKKCAFDCGVRFCNSRCWKEGRARHEGTCSILQKKAILRRLRIGNGEADELF